MDHAVLVDLAIFLVLGGYYIELVSVVFAT
jgi:hypothetical protein